MPLHTFKLAQKVQTLQDTNLLRRTHALDTGVTPTIVMNGKQYINFASNDYLGLAQHPLIAETMQNHVKYHGVGSGASHLVSGHFSVHEQLETELAHMSGYESAMLFSSGFMANIGVIPALLRKDDVLLQDRLNHASLIDGGRLTKAHRTIYNHLNYQDLETQLQETSDTNKLIISDHVFSMDGTVASMPTLSQLAEKYNAGLLIDDAHGFGLYYGQKTPHTSITNSDTHHNADIYMATLGKAVGCYGAFVAGSHELITFLKSTARSYIFTTALPTGLAVASLQALEIIKQEPERQHQLQHNIAHLRAGLQEQGWQLLDSETAIQPVIIGTEEDTLAIAHQLQEAGFWIIAIRPPTVPKGTCRLRITVSASHTQSHIEQLLATMATLTI